MAEPRTFGQRLRRCREHAGLSQTDLAHRSGIPKANLSRYENDRILPSIVTLRRLSAALDVSEGELLGQTPTNEEHLYRALRDRGVVIRSKADAQRIAELVARKVLRGEEAAG